MLDHAFGQSDPYTLGVEEEYMLLDGETFDLVQHVDTVLAAVVGHELEPVINPELMQSVLEIATPVCHTPAEVADQLRRIRGYVIDVAREQGMRVGSAGTHPFSLFERQRITARDRYHALVDQMQYVARRELIFGLHIHVAVDNPEKAIQVVNGLLAHLGQLLALSASSPFWRGEPTGLRSSRQMVFAAFPRSGPAAALQRLRRLCGGRRPAGEDGLHRGLHAHLVGHPPAPPPRHDRDPHLRRGHAHGGRRRDRRVLPGAREALLRALRQRRGDPDSYHRILTTENKWLAGRYGLEAPLMDLATGRRNRIPVAQLIRRTLKEIEPHARELGSDRELQGIEEILRKGNGADRQLRVFNANRDIVEVASEIAKATEVAVAEELAT